MNPPPPPPPPRFHSTPYTHFQQKHLKDQSHNNFYLALEICMEPILFCPRHYLLFEAHSLPQVLLKTVPGFLKR